MNPLGLIAVNKPSGVTSRDVVDHVWRLVRPARAGHAGTLDPMARGVLVVCVGSATRLIPYVQATRKAYHGTFLLGRSSDTEDTDGTVTELPDPPIPSLEQIQAAETLTGEILQRPPAYSAVKIQGKRAYELARKGKPVETKPRPVMIHRLDVVQYAYPELVLDIECGSGTYVRTLGRDLAESLGTCAVMSALVRTSVGSFRLEDSIAMESLTETNLAEHVKPALLAVADLPRVIVTPSELAELRHGRAIARATMDATEDTEYAAIDEQSMLVALLRPRGDGVLGPVRNFV